MNPGTAAGSGLSTVTAAYPNVFVARALVNDLSRAPIELEKVTVHAGSSTAASYSPAFEGHSVWMGLWGAVALGTTVSLVSVA